MEVDQKLDKSAEKRAGMGKQKKTLRGRQETLNNVITFIANITALGRFRVKVKDDNFPMILNILMDITDLIYSVEYRSFDEKSKGSIIYMAYTLVVYIFNIFAVFVQSAKMPKVIRKFKVTNGINFKHL